MPKAVSPWVLIGAMMGSAHATTVELQGMYGTNVHGGADVLGSFHATVTVGSTAQRDFKVLVDTGSIGLALPADSLANFAGTTHYGAELGGQPVGCHSPQCDTRFQSEAGLEVGGHLALCEVRTPANEAYPNGFVICPRENTAEFEAGKGRCRIGPSVQAQMSAGPPVACADHLSCGAGCGCNEVMALGYACDLDMAAFSPTLAGQQLSEFCPESCNSCAGAGGGGTRFCADNEGWHDDSGRDCTAYAAGNPQHSQCFNTAAFAACPVSCDACGDCCNEADECYFYVQFIDGTAVTGSKVENEVEFGPGLRTHGVVEVFDWASDDPVKFDPDGDYDGVLGLGFAAEHCNPACSETLWDSLISAESSMEDLFALCLSGLHESTDVMISGKSSWDIGTIDHEKYTGAIHWFPIPAELEGRPNEHYFTTGHIESVNIAGPGINIECQSLGICAYELSRNLLPGETHAEVFASCENNDPNDPNCVSASLSAEQMPTLILLDSGSSQVKLPTDLYTAFANKFYNNISPSFNMTHADGTTEFVNGGALGLWGVAHGGKVTTDDTCIGPVALDYDPDTQFFPIEFTVVDEDSELRTFVLPARNYLVKRRYVEGKADPGENRRWLCNGIGLTPLNHLGLSSQIVVLGTVFMSEHYTIFDRGNSRIGLAEIRNCLSGLDMENYPCTLDLPEHASMGNCPATGVLSRGSACAFTCEAGFEIDPASANFQPECAVTGLVSDIVCVETSSACASDPCQHESFCIELPDGSDYKCCDDQNDDPLDERQCLCPPGFENVGGNINCAVQIDDCLSRPCHGDSVCTSGIDTYSCACEPGFNGDNCAEEVDECVSDPCSVHAGHATGCEDAIDDYVCICASGWSGDDCDVENVCLTGSHDCGANSHCDSIDGAAHTCPCTDGYSRSDPSPDAVSDCSVVDICASVPCLNGASCTNLDGIDYRCTCTAGWSGDECELDIDECISEPCDHGDCSDSTTESSVVADSYSCACEADWEGDNCADEAGGWQMAECAGGEFHINPLDCEAIDYCTGHVPGNYRPGMVDENPCLHGSQCNQLWEPGTRVPEPPYFSCSCVTGWAGERCEDVAMPDPCFPNPCGLGDCLAGGAGTYSCLCEDGTFQQTPCEGSAPAPPPPSIAPVAPPAITLPPSFTISQLTCSIQAVFSGLTSIKNNPDCRMGCNSNSGDCPDNWTPGADDACSAACGQVFEPFWDSCGTMLTNAHMGGMDDMGIFYDSCLETLYPPGSCGSFCNTHTFECYLAEVQEACCDEGGQNCVSGEDVPESCPIGCAIVFPQFLETCTDHLASTGANVADMQTFQAECLAVDGLELVEYAIMLLERGCSINLDGLHGAGRRMLLGRPLGVQLEQRRLQAYLAPHLSSEEPLCTWDRVDDFAKEVDSVCCGNDNSGCPAGQPPADCSPGCAVTVHQFMMECSVTLAVILEPDDPFRANLESFEGICMDAAAGTQEFLTAIMGAHCPVEGEAFLIREQGAANSGWSSTDSTCPATEVTDVGSAGTVHGPWGNDCTDVSIQINIPADITSCEVSWTSWAIDSRDDELDSVQIDGVEVWSATARCHGGGDGWELGPADFPNPYQGQQASEVCLAENVVVVACSGVMTIQFLSGIDEAEANEAWAFSNVQVIGSNGETVLLDETRAAAADGAASSGWSNTEVTNVGSAGNVHGPWGNDATDVSIELAIPAGVGFCEVSWRQWAVDSRDGEVDRVTVNGEEVWSMPISRPDQGCEVGWEEGPTDFPNPWGGAEDTCFDEIEVQLPCSPPTMTLNFLSGIDQAENDESWAFSDVRVVGRPDAGAAGGGGNGH